MLEYKIDIIEELKKAGVNTTIAKETGVFGLNNKEERNLTEEMSVFKSYLRRLLQDLKDLKEALKNKEYERAETMVDKLIDDTQKGIEDN